MICVYLDPQIAINLRQTVNEDAEFSYRHMKEISHANHKMSPAWQRICTLMDRIQDTAEHINGIQLHDIREKRIAFSFLDLMNHSSVLIDCVYEIARIYEIDMAIREKSTEIFHKPGKDDNGSDKEYFEYLRSLCSVHPINTARHKRYQDGEYECCPYVYWGDEIYGTGIYNVNAKIYTDVQNSHKIEIISIQSIKAYIEYVYGLIDSKVIPGIEAFKERYRERYRKQVILSADSFSDYKEYLCNIKEESQRRYGDELDSYIDNTLRFFSVQFQDKKNRLGLIKFQNALKLAVHFYHSSLQNMNWTGYENTGIRYPTESDGVFLLDQLLFIRDTSRKAILYGYEIGTFSELCSEDDSYYPYSQIEKTRPFLEKYVTLDEAKTRIETYVLTQIALYKDALNNKNIINQNIPNELLYRFRRLSENGIEKLRKPPMERKKKSNKKTLEEYIEMAHHYLSDS